MFRTYFDTKLEHMQDILERVGAQSMEVRIEKFPTNSAYKVMLEVSTDKGHFLASEDDHTLAEALDFAKDKLVQQMRRALDREKDKHV